MAKISYKFLAHPADDVKLPPQAKTILKVLENLGEVVTKEDLVSELNKPTETSDNALNARQPVERVLAFYQKRLADEGYFEIIKEAAAPKEKSEAGSKTAPKGKAKVPEAADAPEEVAESMKV